MSTARYLLAATLGLAACRLGFDAPANGDGGRDSGGGSDSSDGGTDPTEANVAFVTSTRFPADFGGIAVADAECAQHAATAGLTGEFIALLGDATTAPLTRLVGSRGWADTKGRLIVDEPSHWLDGGMWHPLEYNENGDLVGYTNVWLGALSDYNCTSWTATLGQSSIVTTRSAFGGFSSSDCSQTMPLVCVQIGRDQPLVHASVPGRRVFMTNLQWLPGGGRADADATCASDAVAAGLSGTFLALLATSTESRWSRFSTAGPTWTNLDGIPLAQTAAEVVALEPDELDAFANTRAAGGYYPYATQWGGSPTANCADWMDATTGSTGRAGAGQYVQKMLWLDYFDVACNNLLFVTCVEQ